MYMSNVNRGGVFSGLAQEEILTAGERAKGNYLGKQGSLYSKAQCLRSNRNPSKSKEFSGFSALGSALWILHLPAGSAV
jgi:hypothetical protein